LKAFLRVLDHAAVYLLIAGTYTPVALVALNGGWGWGLFGAEWLIASLGIVLKILYPGRFERLSIVLYLALGWAGLAALGRLIDNVPWPGLALMAAGGIFFTSGVFFHTRTRLR
jgi:hemolysin III